MNVLKGKAPTKSIPKLKGVKDERTDLKVIEDPNSPDGVRRFLLVPNVDAPTPGTGDQQQKSADGLTHEIVGVIPRKASWKQNGIRTADELSLSIRWQDMPIDPRVVRACAVQYYFGAVTAENNAAGIAGFTRNTGRSMEPLNLVPDTYIDKKGRQRTNLRFQGWVDQWKLTVGDGEALIELSCVDNTRLLEKQVRPPMLHVGMEQPIDEAIATYLTHFPQMNGLTVEYLPRNTAPADIPRLKGILAHSSFVPNFGPPTGGGGSTSASSETVLDYLTTIVGSIAHSLRIDGTRLIIQRATNLLGSTRLVSPDARPGSRESDPYEGRDLPSGRYPVRAFILGKNIRQFSVERDYVKKQPKNIEVRSYDAERKNVNVARFPEAGDDQLITTGPGDGKADKDWTVVQVSDGVRDKQVLKDVAEEIYNTTGRQELLVTVKTNNLASFGGDNEDPDLLDMTVGDAFEVLINRSPDEGTTSEVETALSAATFNEEMMTSLGFTAEFAAAYAKAYTDAGFQREYKLREMTADFDVDEGASFELTGMNYIVARVDRPGENSGQESGAGKARTGQPAQIYKVPGFTFTQGSFHDLFNTKPITHTTSPTEAFLDATTKLVK